MMVIINNYHITAWTLITLKQILNVNNSLLNLNQYCSTSDPDHVLLIISIKINYRKQQC